MKNLILEEDARVIFDKQIDEYNDLMSTPHNIVFLDIDGVFNTCACKDRTPNGFVGIMDSRVKTFKKLIDKIDAKVVLTSTWKEGWTREMKPGMFVDAETWYMMNKFHTQGIHIADKTEDNASMTNRGHGIVKWLNEHPYKNFVIIDDTKFFDFKPLKLLPNLILTGYGPNGGILPKHTKMAERIVNTRRFKITSMYPLSIEYGDNNQVTETTITLNTQSIEE